MTFDVLIEKLSKSYEIELLSYTDSSDLQYISLVDSRNQPSPMNTLYIGYDRQLESLSSIPTHCILVKTTPTPTKISKNMAFVSEECLFQIFNDAKMLIKENNCEGIFEKLTSVADSTRNIDAVIDAASTYLQNTLIFCDRNFKVISSSTIYPVTDTTWAEYTKQGYCSYDFIHEIKKLNVIKNASLTTASIEVTCPLSPGRKLSSKVFHNQKQVGFLLMLEGETLISPTHFAMLSIISHVISYTIAFYLPNLFEQNSPYHEVLYNMLIGVPPKDVLPVLKELSFPDEMCVLFIRSTRYFLPSYLKESIGKILKKQIPGTHITTIDKGIAAVIPYKQDPQNEMELDQICKNLSESQHLRIGISYSFKQIQYFSTYYAQARSALELGKQLKSEFVCRYWNYQTFDLFSEMKQPNNLGRFCHPALSVLRKNDQENNAELYKTLCVYIENACSIKLTAKALYIHRNSLVYRLNRIIELCHLNLSDTNTLFLLRLSFLIDRYNELNTISEWS